MKSKEAGWKSWGECLTDSYRTTTENMVGACGHPQITWCGGEHGQPHRMCCVGVVNYRKHGG